MRDMFCKFDVEHFLKVLRIIFICQENENENEIEVQKFEVSNIGVSDTFIQVMYSMPVLNLYTQLLL